MPLYEERLLPYQVPYHPHHLVRDCLALQLWMYLALTLPGDSFRRMLSPHVPNALIQHMTTSTLKRHDCYSISYSFYDSMDEKVKCRMYHSKAPSRQASSDCPFWPELLGFTHDSA